MNLKEHVGKAEMNVNMGDLRGQATIPIVNAVSQVQSVKYGEIIATVSSKVLVLAREKILMSLRVQHLVQLVRLVERVKESDHHFKIQQSQR